MAVHEINQMSLRQAITPERILGRVNANLRMIELGALLAVSLAAGLLGLRVALVFGASAGLLGALWLAVSPARQVRGLPPSKMASPSPSDAA